MEKPFSRALAVIVYIVIIFFIFNFLDPIVRSGEILSNVIEISLLVLSIVVIGFLFFFDPFLLYKKNNKKGAVMFFVKTIGIFVCLAVLFSVILMTIRW